MCPSFRRMTHIQRSWAELEKLDVSTQRGGPLKGCTSICKRRQGVTKENWKKVCQSMRLDLRMREQGDQNQRYEIVSWGTVRYSTAGRYAKMLRVQCIHEGYNVLHQSLAQRQRVLKFNIITTRREKKRNSCMQILFGK